MEDLLAKMQEILSSEEGQQQLKEMAEMLSNSSAEDSASQEGEQQTSEPDFSFLNGFLEGMMGQNTSSDESPSNHEETGQNGFGFDLNLLLQLQKIFSSMQEEDDNTKLLLALKPHFREERREKIDQAVQMLRLFSILPLLKDSGLLGGLFGNGKS